MAAQAPHSRSTRPASPAAAAPSAAPAAHATAPPIGNLGLQRLLQARLSIGATHDPLEAEADRIADQVLASPAASPVSATPLRLQRTAEPAGDNGPGAPASVERVLASAGRPLDEALRHDMERRFGHDFSQVRIHSDAAADQSTQDANAQAYTVGEHLVFGAGRFDPGTHAGRHLIAHELTHVVQQGYAAAQGPGLAAMALQRRYRLSELQSTVSGIGTGNMVSGTPPTLFYPGSAANTTDRRALVIAGIHGTEASAIALGAELESELSSGSLVPDFHTLFVPRVNLTGGRGTSHVSDLNREFGGSTASAEPIAGEVQAMVTEFEPERILSVHSIGNTGLSGIYLDPIRPTGGTAAAYRSGAARASAFTHDPRNDAAMALTEDLVTAVRSPAGAAGAAGVAATPGNTPGDLPLRVRGSTVMTPFPASLHPGATSAASPYTLLYPQQSQVGSGAHGETSLGVWASQLPFAPAVVTLEVPGDAVASGGSNWRPFLPALRRFLRLPAGPAGPAGGGSAAPTGTVQRRARPGPAVLRRVPLSERDLTPPRGIPFAFVQEVYRRQVAIWTARGAAYVHTVASGNLRSLASGDAMPGPPMRVHRDIAGAVHDLLTAARSDLSAAHPAGVTGLAVRSGYRSAPDQFGIWQRFFPTYYRRTAAARMAATGGAHGPAAAQLLAEYINERVFSPGYSPHQRGRTIDFTYQSATEWAGATGHWAEADSSAAGIATWESSWFYAWLRGHAHDYGFAQNPAIHEPWHWEFDPLLLRLAPFGDILGLSGATLARLIRLWRALLRRLGVEPAAAADDADDESDGSAADDPPSEAP